MSSSINTCVNAAAQFAGIAALDGPDDSIDEMMEKFTLRRKLIHEGLNSLPGVECSLPGGAFYAFPKVIGTGMDGSEFCKRAMHEAGVAIVPGTAFGKTCKDYVRFSFAASRGCKAKSDVIFACFSKSCAWYYSNTRLMHSSFTKFTTIHSSSNNFRECIKCSTR